MRRIRFALYFALGLFLVTLTTIVLLMVQTAPSQSNVPFMGIVVDPGSRAFTEAVNSSSQTPIVYLPNRLFDCTNQSQQFRCQATLKDQPLEITFDQGKDYIYNLENCRAAYAGKTIACKPGWGGYMTNRGILAFYGLNTDLGLTVAQLQALKQQYWLTNLIGSSAEGFIWIATLAIAIMGALLAIGLNWLDDNRLTRIFTSLSSGFVLALFVRSSLGGIPFTVLAQYGISAATWNFALPVGTIAFGVAVSILTGLYVSRRTVPAIKGLASLLMGSAMAVFAWFLVPIVSSILPGGFLLRIPLTLLVGVGTVILLWKDTRRSIKVFSCSISAMGAFSMLLMLLLRLSLDLGFAD